MDTFLYIRIFTENFCFFIRVCSFIDAVKGANTIALDTVHVARLKKAFDRGVLDFTLDIKLDANPFNGEYAIAWKDGWQYELERKLDIPEVLRKQA